MDLSSLEIFMAVAGQRSVTAAARQLGRAPSNVTTRLQQLERQQGVTLFERGGRQMTLTAEGEIFRTFADRFLSLAVDMQAALRPTVLAGSLRLGTMESTAASRLPRPLARFRALYPAVTVHLSIGATAELIGQVTSGALDCALVADMPETFAGDQRRTLPPGCRGDPVFREDLLLVLPQAHEPITTPADLQVSQIAVLEPGCTYRQMAERWIAGTGHVELVEVNSYHAIAATVLAGSAAGIVPRSVLDFINWHDRDNSLLLSAVDTLMIRPEGAPDPCIEAFLGVLATSAAPGPESGFTGMTKRRSI